MFGFKKLFLSFILERRTENIKNREKTVFEMWFQILKINFHGAINVLWKKKFKANFN